MQRRSPEPAQRGFTLIELMIVVAAVAILAAIALPSYRQQVLKSHRADAKSALLDLAARQERYFTVNNAYTNSGTALGYANAFPVNVTTNGSTYYVLSLPTLTATTFTAQAAPTGTQLADSCGTYQVNNLGQQTVSTTATNCW